MPTATMQRPMPAGVRADPGVPATAAPTAAPDPLATTRASHGAMRSVLQDLEARKHSRSFTDNDRIRLLRTRAVDGLLTDTVSLVKTDREAISYLRWRANKADAEAAGMQARRPSIWFPGRRRAADEQIREKRAMAQEAASFATSIDVDLSTKPKPPVVPEPAGPSRAGSDQHLKTLTDFLAPIEQMAGTPGFTPAHETQLLRGRRVRRILETAIQGASTDAQVVLKLQAIRGAASGQLRHAEASTPTDTARIQELREVVKDCGTYAGFLTAPAPVPVHRPPAPAVRRAAPAGPQGRVQKGVRNGGEWTARAHGEADVTLGAAY